VAERFGRLSANTNGAPRLLPDWARTALSTPSFISASKLAARAGAWRANFHWHKLLLKGKDKPKKEAVTA
jgi:hypothetical protein